MRNRTMHDRARPKAEPPATASAPVAVRPNRSARLNPVPRHPRPPIRITSRRFQPSQSRTPGPRSRSIGTFL